MGFTRSCVSAPYGRLSGAVEIGNFSGLRPIRILLCLLALEAIGAWLGRIILVDSAGFERCLIVINSI